MAAMLCDSIVVVAIVRMHPRTILLAMITMRKSTQGFPLLSYNYEYGALLGGPSGCWSSANTCQILVRFLLLKTPSD